MEGVNKKEGTPPNKTKRNEVKGEEVLIEETKYGEIRDQERTIEGE